MNIAVLVKLVPDTQAVLKIGEDKRSIAKGDLNFVLNPFDEYAVEEGLKTKEKLGGKVTVVSLGADDSVKAIRTALAMGADEGLHVKPTSGLDMLGVAKSLAAALKGREFDLILAGKQAADDDCGAIGPMVAELMDIPHVSAANRVEIEESRLTASREVEGGVEVFELPLPALITAEKGLNEPRYASLKGIMMAKKKNIETLDAESIQPRTEITNMSYPPVRAPGKIVGQGVDAVPELVRLLREEAKVL